MPKLEYPATFENGVIGVRCKEDIENREAYLYVPYKMMLTVRKVKEVPELAKIIPNYKECFDEETTHEAEALTLTLGIFYEIAKGRKSYWYPYLRQMLDTEIIARDWNDHELEMI